MQTTKTTSGRPSAPVSAAEMPASIAQSRIQSGAFRFGWAAALHDLSTRTETRCPYAQPHMISAWYAGYRCAKRTESAHVR